VAQAILPVLSFDSAFELGLKAGFEFDFDLTGAPSFPILFYGKGGGLDAAPPTSQHRA
jgi:hypothetical protein